MSASMQSGPATVATLAMLNPEAGRARGAHIFDVSAYSVLQVGSQSGFFDYKICFATPT